ncbi:hypothetical protein FHR83_006739 [Actinoplanes campanulatus]|uniref:Uncharacterized protein n=2 Tax=Actinoplanes campanulatus TaxID=113559 RepID=A0A7W5AMJ4_9ACTN|nr:hypothetical protein [Actinoplanes campanulatus]MBB3099033.1 hypothetical protein [Actinoplanes campanulatus]
MLLASLITGFRPVSDLVHLMRGQEPPHLTKARLRAETEKLRLAAKQAKTENRRPRPGEDKPTIGDVARVYWGDALADVIAAHDRRRTEKHAQRDEDRAAAEEQRPARRVRPLWKERLARLAQMLVRPVGDARHPGDTETTPAPAGDASTEPKFTDPAGTPKPSATKLLHRWDCDDCGIGCDGYPDDDAAAAAGQQHIDTVHGGRGRPMWRPTPIPDRVAADCPGCGPTPDPDAALCSRCVTKRIAADHRHGRNCRRPGCPTCTAPHSHTPPVDNHSTTRDEEENPMTDTMPAATGDAHDVESALNECSLLGDDLTRIDTSLDVIDEAITSAGAAAERIEAFLMSKRVDDCAVGGMSVARDMLSPTHIKALIDAISAAKQGVQAAEEELRRLQELESQLNGADGSVLNGR